MPIFYQLRSSAAPARQSSAPDQATAQAIVVHPDIVQLDLALREQFPRPVYRAKSTQLPELSESCARCGFDFLMPSRPRGLREEFLDVVGIQYYRCHQCEARYARVGSRNIGRHPRKERPHVWAILAISGGLLSCTALALYIQKLAHRWPF